MNILINVTKNYFGIISLFVIMRLLSIGNGKFILLHNFCRINFFHFQYHQLDIWNWIRIMMYVKLQNKIKNNLNVKFTGCQVAKSIFAVLFSYSTFYKNYSTFISKSIQKFSTFGLELGKITFNTWFLSDRSIFKLSRVRVSTIRYENSYFLTIKD